MTEEPLFRDENRRPTTEIIAEILGPANSTYTSFIEELEDHDIQVEWRYYHDGKTWLGKGLYTWSTIRGTQKERNTFWLSIFDGFFKVTIYIPERVRTEALNLPLNHEVLKMIEDSKQIGKLKFFPLIFDLC